MSCRPILYILVFSFISSLLSAQCGIGTLSTNATNCNNDDQFNVIIDFEFNNIGNAGFTLFGNGTNYGDFEYSQLPVSIGPLTGDCTTAFEFIARDIEIPSCLNFGELGIVCCSGECNISALAYESSICEDDQFDVMVNFEHENSGSAFVAYINGTLYDSFSYSELPLNFTDFPSSGFNQDHLIICDVDEPDCCEDVWIESPCFCEINAFRGRIIDCDENDGSFYIRVDAELSIAVDSFLIGGNGNQYGNFSKNDLPLTLGPFSMDTTIWTFNMISLDDPTCNDSYFLGKVEECPTCEIRDFNVTQSDCDGEFVQFELNFIYENNESDSFNVLINDNYFSSLAYTDSPYTVGPIEGNCDTLYTITVQDEIKTDCMASYELEEAICCEAFVCEINITEIEAYDCNTDGQYFLDFAIDENAGSENGFIAILNLTDTFELNYGQEFYTLGPLTGTCNQIIRLEIIDNGTQDCENAELYMLQACCLESCSISDLELFDAECTSAETFNTSINFNYTDPASEAFTVSIDGNQIGIYAYANLPVRLSNLPTNGETNFFVKVCDAADENCCQTIGYEIEDCSNQFECDISSLSVTAGECDEDGFFFAELNLSFSNPSSLSFVVRGNGIIYDTFFYGAVPYIIGPLEGDCLTEYEFIAIDLEDPNCSADTGFDMGVICCESGDCVISEVFAEAYPCDENGQFLVDIDFDVTNPGNSGFIVRGNGTIYDTFQYGLPFYTIGPLDGDCETIYEFQVQDLEFNDCSSNYEFEEEICCEIACSFSDIEIELGECTGNGTYGITLNFDYTGNTNEFFDVFSSGQLLGTFAYADLPVTLNNIPERQVEFDIIQICDNDNPNCCQVFEFLGLDCMEGNDCNIRDLLVEPGECDEEGFFYVDFEFIVSNPTANQFIIRGNGVVYDTFEYGEESYTIGPLEGDCETIYEFVVIDLEDGDCTADYAFSGPICCSNTNECSFSDFEIELLECSGPGTYNAWINFTHSGTVNAFFEVWSQGIYLGLYAFDDLPVLIENIPERSVTYDILSICENDNEDCCQIFEFMGLDCEESNCTINDLFVEVSECEDNGTFFVDFEFNVDNPVSNQFLIRGNGVIYDTFDYGNTFYTIGPLNGDCETIYEFIVVDLEQESCADEFVFEEAVCCDLLPCELEILVDLENIEIDSSGNATIIADLEYQSTGNVGFDVFVNGEFICFHDYEDLPITFNVPTQIFGTNFTLTFCDNDFECCDELEIEVEVNLCEFDGLEIEVQECDSVFFDVIIDFEANVTNSDSFALYVQNEYYDRYHYNEIPFTAGPFIGRVNLNYEFRVIDELYFNCELADSITAPPCILDNINDLYQNAFKIIQQGNYLLIDADLPMEQFEIFSITGQRLFSEKLSGNKARININEIAQGLYVVKIGFDQKNISRMIAVF